MVKTKHDKTEHAFAPLIGFHIKSTANSARGNV